MEELRIDPTIAYDVVELPSRGIYYSSKKKSVRVSYLTAVDENILTSPNLITTNSVVDELLKRKILDRDITVDEIDMENNLILGRTKDGGFRRFHMDNMEKIVLVDIDETIDDDYDNDEYN